MGLCLSSKQRGVGTTAWASSSEVWALLGTTARSAFLPDVEEASQHTDLPWAMKVYLQNHGYNRKSNHIVIYLCMCRKMAESYSVCVCVFSIWMTYMQDFYFINLRMLLTK